MTPIYKMKHSLRVGGIIWQNSTIVYETFSANLKNLTKLKRKLPKTEQIVATMKQSRTVAKKVAAQTVTLAV